MKKAKEKKEKIHSVRILVKSIREYKKYAILNPIIMILEVICEMMLPFFMGKLVNVIAPTDTLAVGTIDFKMLAIYSSVLIVLACLSLFLGFMGGKIAAIAATGFAKNLRHDLFKQIQSFSFENIDRFSSSSLITRMTTDINYVQMAFQMLIRITFRVPVMMVIAIIMAFSINYRLAFVFALILPLLATTLAIVAYLSFKIFYRVFKKYDKVNSSIQENIRGIRVVKDYAREDYEIDKFTKTSDNLMKDFMKAERIAALVKPSMTFFMYLAGIIIAILGTLIIIRSQGGLHDAVIMNINFGTLKTGDLTAILTYGIQMLSSLMILAMIMVVLTMSFASARRLAEVLNEKPTLSNPINPITTVENGEIEFENVCFKYNLDAEKFALKDINLSIKSGSSVGIIGGTGSSKTTLINLISRLYDVTCGNVLVAGHNVKDYDLKILRDNVAVVLQNNLLFSGTIASNLRWGNKDASDEEIVEAAKCAAADEFIQSFPDKYETKISQGGTNVSGGQKQRLCIARALLKKPKIIILDDSTSAVDTKTDSLIRESFAKNIPDTTKIIIAQRISSIKDCDLIIVMENGTIDGMGTNDELLKTNKIYKEIYDIQITSGGNISE